MWKSIGQVVGKGNSEDDDKSDRTESEREERRDPKEKGFFSSDSSGKRERTERESQTRFR